jgi:hypothetical protein
MVFDISISIVHGGYEQTFYRGTHIATDKQRPNMFSSESRCRAKQQTLAHMFTSLQGGAPPVMFVGL